MVGQVVFDAGLVMHLIDAGFLHPLAGEDRAAINHALSRLLATVMHDAEAR